jgi:chromosome segregation ATPase
MFNIFKKSGPEKVKVNELLNFLEKEFQNEIKSAGEKMQKSVSDITDSLNNMKKLFYELKKKKYEPTKEKKEIFDEYSTNVKNRFCDRSIEIIDQIPYTEISYDNVLKFLDSASEKIKQISDINFKEFRHLHAFRSELKEIASSIKNLEAKIKISSEAMKKFQNVKKINILEQETIYLKKLIQDTEDTKKRTYELKNEITENEKILEKKRSELNSFLKTFEEYEELKNTENELEKDKSLIKMKITTAFSGLDKVLRKLKHIEKKQQQIIDDYIKNPADAFLSDDELEIRKIIQKIKEISEELEMDEKKHKNIVFLESEIENLVSDKNQIKDIEKKIKETRRDIMRFDGKFMERKQKEEEIKKLNVKIEEISGEIEKKSIELKSKNNDIERTKQKITQNTTDLLKRHVDVVFD